MVVRRRSSRPQLKRRTVRAHARRTSRMSNRPSRTDWVGVLPKVAFGAASKDPRFHLIITLGRVVNALTLSRLPLLRPVKWQSPRVRRERQAAFVYAAAVLYEGLRVAVALATHYRRHPKWSTTFGPILADAELRKMRQRYLKPLRDKTAFHFDIDVTREALTAIENEELIVVSGRGAAPHDIYFDLSDDVMLVRLFARDGHRPHLPDLERFMNQTSDLFTRFMHAAHRFMPAVLAEFGVRRRPPRPTDPAQRARRAL